MIPQFMLRQAANVFYSGGILCYPTESVFGLGCDPLDETAVQQILNLKNRPVEKGLILIGSSIDQLLPYIDIKQSDIDKILTCKTPTTWLVNKSELTPPWITGEHKKLAIRVTQHPVAHALCDACQSPLVSTSANPAGKHPAKNQLMVRHYFLSDVDFIVAGKVGALKKPTEIRDLETNKILRSS